MLRFKTWIEHVLMEEDEDLKLSREQKHLVNRFYDRIVKELVGGDKKNITMDLSDFEDSKAGPGAPPKHKGSQAVMSKLSPIFAQMKNAGIPELTARVGHVENWLQKMATDQKVGPGAQVKDLLTNLFGQNAVELYGGDAFQASPNATPQPPQDNAQTPADATAPPMSAEQPPAGGMAPPPGGPGMPPGGAPPMGGDPAMGGMPPMGAPPMGGAPAPGGMPPMGGPLQSPGGPTPPMPPAGIF